MLAIFFKQIKKMKFLNASQLKFACKVIKTKVRLDPMKETLLKNPNKPNNN